MSQSGNQNPLAAFEAAFSAWAAVVKDDIKKFASAFLPEVESDVEIAFADLAAIAGNAVLGQASSLISGQEKFGAAVASVVQTVEAQGKTVAIQTAQTAVQQAYIGIKAIAQNAQPAS